jgi:hypothetical protein
VLGLSFAISFKKEISEWGAPTNSFFLKRKKDQASYLIGPSPIFLEHWGGGSLPQHKNLNMLPSPKIEACFVMLPVSGLRKKALLLNPLIPVSCQ